MTLESILTHFVCILIGSMIGVTTMAFCSASGRASREEEEREWRQELRMRDAE